MGDRKRRRIAIAVEEGDVLTFNCDVLALKYAQAIHGLDYQVALHLSAAGMDLKSLLPRISGSRFIPTAGKLGAKAVLFVGVKPLGQFDYREIRRFGTQVLTSLAGSAPRTPHLCLTVQGPNYGLDETEAFSAEIDGLADALGPGETPDTLQRGTVLPHDPRKAT